jgi:hypothetical protein
VSAFYGAATLHVLGLMNSPKMHSAAALATSTEATGLSCLARGATVESVGKGRNPAALSPGVLFRRLGVFLRSRATA